MNINTGGGGGGGGEGLPPINTHLLVSSELQTVYDSDDFIKVSSRCSGVEKGQL